MRVNNFLIHFYGNEKDISVFDKCIYQYIHSFIIFCHPLLAKLQSIYKNYRSNSITCFFFNDFF